MKNWLTKKNIVICALTLILVGWGANELRYIKYSPAHIIIDPLSALLVSLVPLYFLRDEIFRSWLKFIAWWLPLGSVLSIVALNSSGGFIGNLFPAQFFAFSIIFMSLFLFAIKTLELHRTDGGMPMQWWVKWPTLILAFAMSLVLSRYAY